jgi:hypothetical protein
MKWNIVIFMVVAPSVGVAASVGGFFIFKASVV